MPIPIIFPSTERKPQELTGKLIFIVKYTGFINNVPPEVRTMNKQNMSMYNGEDKTITVYIRDSDLNPINMTGSTSILYVKDSVTSTPILIQKSTDVPSEGAIGAADEGEIFFFLVPADTVSLASTQLTWGVDVTVANGKKYTVLDGQFTLAEPVN